MIGSATLLHLVPPPPPSISLKFRFTNVVHSTLFEALFSVTVFLATFVRVKEGEYAWFTRGLATVSGREMSSIVFLGGSRSF